MPLTPRSGAVLFGKNLARLHAFYAEVAGLSLTHVGEDHVVLESPTFQLVVHAIPPEFAAMIEVATPPIRRTDTPIKLVLPVASIDATRAAAARLGGELDPPERVWDYQGCRVCDGHDPEGNVVQFREEA